MNSKLLTVFLAVSAIASLTELIGVYLCVNVKKKDSILFACMAFACCVVNCSYVGSILTTDYFFTSVMSSIYFASIDWMLVAFLTFIAKRTGYYWKKFHIATCIYALYETILFAVNPFKEIAVSYAYRPTGFACYTYEIKPFYTVHLIATYTAILVILALLLKKIFSVPRQYQKQYYIIIVGILFIVLVNVAFLFVPGNHILTMLDYSVLTYGVMLRIVYWGCYQYTAKEMLQSLSMTIFDNISQGLILFDYEGNVVMKNEKALQLFAHCGIDLETVTSEEFLIKLKIQDNLDDTFTTMCYVEDEAGEIPVRCDYRTFKEGERKAGNLLTFTDLHMETDVITGFHNWEFFVKHDEDRYRFEKAVTIIAVDINNLALINASFGRDVGDLQIQKLSRLLRDNLPNTSYFLRGRDAHLIAICPSMKQDEIYSVMQKIKKEMGETLFQYASSDIVAENEKIHVGVDRAIQSLNTKKLLDADAAHSKLLEALVRALKAVDSDTEEHVKRTQQMGERIGSRLQLSDLQKSELSLLCILHDIGKISVPVDILNKPGKLSEDEQSILKMHPQKGYEIAQSAPELRSIAPMILHHHEHWDGSGYPDGLSCESIPLLSRIIAVVDAYDAMAYNRSYRKALPVSAIYSQLRKNAGTMFDPHIVAEFIAMLEENDTIVEEELVEKETSPSVISPNNVSEEQEADSRYCAELIYTRYRMNADDRIIFVDDNFQKITGYSREDIENQNIYQATLIPEEDQASYFVEVAGQLAKTSAALMEHRILRKDGSIRFVFCYGRRYYDSAAKEIRIEIIATDMSDTNMVKNVIREETNKSMNRLRQWENTYRVDALTGLLNRPAYQSELDEQLLHHKKIGFMMMDIDRFKQVNDTHGHQVGDECLIYFAQELTKVIGDVGATCRMGGDEFSAALYFDEEISDEDVENQIRGCYAQLCELEKDELKIQSSMGAVISNTNVNTFSGLYVKADNALYKSKEGGRARLSFARNN